MGPGRPFLRFDKLTVPRKIEGQPANLKAFLPQAELYSLQRFLCSPAYQNLDHLALVLGRAAIVVDGVGFRRGDFGHFENGKNEKWGQIRS